MAGRSFATAIVLTVVTALTAVATPVAAGAAGGSITYALEEETPGGYCTGADQLAISGIMVENAVYDTLTAINSQGKYVPYLAKSITPNATYDRWTIELRPGIRFQNGEALDANAVKLNLDKLRHGLLTSFTFTPVTDVQVTGPLTVVVTTKAPWLALPGALWGGGRFGIAAPEQLNSPDCATKLIGTGPFRLVSWRPQEELVVERNPDYWRPGLPRIDRITFKPVGAAETMVNGLISGQFDVIQTSNARAIEHMRKLAAQKKIRLDASDKNAEVGYLLLNVSKPPFNDPVARRAVAYAGDREEINAIINDGTLRLADGPFPPGSPAYLPKSGYPPHNLKRARALVRRYERTHNEKLAFEYETGTSPDLIQLAQLVQKQLQAAGITTKLKTVDEASQINDALAGSFQAQAFRNHPGGDPDLQYPWWHSGSPINFGRIKDPEIDRLLDAGRVETDPAKRARLYQELNRRFAHELYDLWTWYTLWGIGTARDVRGALGPPLPDNGGKPFPIFGGYVPVLGLSKTR